MMLNKLIEYSETLASAIRASGHAAAVNRTHFAQQLIAEGIPLFVQYSRCGQHFIVKAAQPKKKQKGTVAVLDLLQHLFSKETLRHLKVA